MVTLYPQRLRARRNIGCLAIAGNVILRFGRFLCGWLETSGMLGQRLPSVCHALQVPQTYRTPRRALVHGCDVNRRDRGQRERGAGPAHRSPRPLLDGRLRSFWQFDGERPLERTLGFLKLQDLVKDLPQQLCPVDILLLGHGDLDSPVLRPPYLQDKLARFFVDAPHLALGQNWLECRAAAEEGDRPWSSVDSKGACPVVSQMGKQPAQASLDYAPTAMVRSN